MDGKCERMITPEQLYRALERLDPYRPSVSDWRKLSNGRIVRFVNWRKAATEASK